MAVTKFDDIVARARPSRPILSEDEQWITGKIDEAEMLLETRRGDLEVWIAAGGTPALVAKRRKAVITVVNRMIERFVKNPDGLFTETDGNYSYGRDRGLTAGEITANIRDWQLLGVSRGVVSSVRMGLPSWSPRNASSC